MKLVLKLFSIHEEQQNLLDHSHRGKRYLRAGYTLLCLGMLCILVIWSYIGGESKKHSFPSPLMQSQTRPATVSPETARSELPTDLEMFKSIINSDYSESISLERWSKLVKDLYWASPDRPITNLSMSTSPTHTTFFIQDPKKTYYVGDELFVTVLAKDFQNKPKQYGGDLFQAKLFAGKSKASVYGEVIDLLNGSYTVRFVLPWVGEAQVAVRLIHSSEAVQVLKHHRNTDVDRVAYNGYYEALGPIGTKRSEVVKCNVHWNGKGLENLDSKDCCCDYRDSQAGEVWHCRKPKTLSCSALVYHSAGGYFNPLSAFEKKLLDRKLTDRYINGDKTIINALPSNASIGMFDAKIRCHPGLQTPLPAGFYLNDVWTSFVCAARHFTPNEAIQCLKDKHIYMMGDSTIRQWFDFLVTTVPTLKKLNLHTTVQAGPYLAVDVQNNFDIHQRSHGPPLRTLKVPVADLHYISNEIDDLAGGPQMFIIFNLNPHFTTHPLALYTRRVLRIRKSVLAMLQRAPATTIIIKTANVSYKDIFGSDWYALQLEIVMRWAFEGIPVYFLDVWQMTSCHYSGDHIHPGPTIIRNEIDILLSFICPK